MMKVPEEKVDDLGKTKWRLWSRFLLIKKPKILNLKTLHNPLHHNFRILHQLRFLFPCTSPLQFFFLVLPGIMRGVYCDDDVCGLGFEAEEQEVDGSEVWGWGALGGGWGGGLEKVGC